MTFTNQMQHYAHKLRVTNIGLNYFQIIQRPVVEPRLNLGKNDFSEFLSRRRINFLGAFKNYTQTGLTNLVKACGGTAITTDDAAIAMSTRYAYVPQRYCLLANRGMIDSFNADPTKGYCKNLVAGLNLLS